MVIGGIGYCDLEGNFQFHKNLMEGIQIYNGSLLFGVYHPRSKNNDKNDRIKYHFMLSPIPYHLWPKMARYIIRLRQAESFGQTTGIKNITEFLYHKKVSIIYSFSNRSAHRYSTWDIHISLDEFTLEDLENDYDPTLSCYKKVYDRANEIAIEIQRNFPDVLFYDNDDIDLKQSIITRVNTSCHYFYYDSERLQQEAVGENKKIYESFTLRYNHGNFIPIKKGIINQVIHLLEPSNMDFKLPSICFAESDSHYLNLRVIIIPKALRHLFFKISIFHERLKSDNIDNNTSRGLLNYVIEALHGMKYKVWKTSTLLFECRDDSYGNGKLSLFVESKNHFKEEASEQQQQILLNFLNYLNESKVKPPHLQHIRLESRCERMFPEIVNRYFIRNRIELEKKKYDVFVSYSHENYDWAEKLYNFLTNEKCNVFMDKAKSYAGGLLSQRIENGLRESREFCILLSKESLKSSWVTTEWGAASISKMFICPILLPGFSSARHKKIDERIKALEYIRWSANPDEELKKYAREIIERRFKSMLYNDSYNY